MLVTLLVADDLAVLDHKNAVGHIQREAENLLGHDD